MKFGGKKAYPSTVLKRSVSLNVDQAYPAILKIKVLVGVLALTSVLVSALLEALKATQPVGKAYWIWNFSDLSYASPGSELILYQGDVTQSWAFEVRGISPHRLQHSGPVTLLFRLYALGPVEDVARQYNSLKRRWETHGTSIEGLQIDYDSPTAKLQEYSLWLESLATVVGKDRLSATSLATYVYDAPEQLVKLSSQVGYIAMQLYAGYSPHDDYEAVIRFLNASKVNHKIGISSSPKFPLDADLCGSHCQGVTTFLNKSGPGQ